MHPIAARWAAPPAFRYEQIRKMEYMIDIMKPEDWQQVRSIYREGIGTGNSTFGGKRGQIFNLDNSA